MSQVTVTELDLVAAMRRYEELSGPSDGITICREVSVLADLLGSMWFHHQTAVDVPADHPAVVLVRAAGDGAQ